MVIQLALLPTPSLPATPAPVCGPGTVTGANVAFTCNRPDVVPGVEVLLVVVPQLNLGILGPKPQYVHPVTVDAVDANGQPLDLVPGPTEVVNTQNLVGQLGGLGGLAPRGSILLRATFAFGVPPSDGPGTGRLHSATFKVTNATPVAGVLYLGYLGARPDPATVTGIVFDLLGVLGASSNQLLGNPIGTVSGVIGNPTSIIPPLTSPPNLYAIGASAQGILGKIPVRTGVDVTIPGIGVLMHFEWLNRASIISGGIASIQIPGLSPDQVVSTLNTAASALGVYFAAKYPDKFTRATVEIVGSRYTYNPNVRTIGPRAVGCYDPSTGLPPGMVSQDEQRWWTLTNVWNYLTKYSSLTPGTDAVYIGDDIDENNASYSGRVGRRTASGTNDDKRHDTFCLGPAFGNCLGAPCVGFSPAPLIVGEVGRYTIDNPPQYLDPMKVFDDALAQKARVCLIELSLDGDPSTGYFKFLRWAANRAFRNGLTIVIPAGNSYSNRSALYLAPEQTVLVATSVNNEGEWLGDNQSRYCDTPGGRVGFTYSYAPGNIAAPSFAYGTPSGVFPRCPNVDTGCGPPSSIPNGCEEFLGTSLAAPQVAALASHFPPEYSAQSVLYYLTGLASHGHLRGYATPDPRIGWGIINVYDTINFLVTARPPDVANFARLTTFISNNSIQRSGGRVRVGVTVTDEGGNPIDGAWVNGAVAFDRADCSVNAPTTPDDVSLVSTQGGSAVLDFYDINPNVPCMVGAFSVLSYRVSPTAIATSGSPMCDLSKAVT